jgi:hypothetical protein
VDVDRRQLGGRGLKDVAIFFGLHEPRADHAAAMAGLAVDLVAAFERLADRRGLTLRKSRALSRLPLVTHSAAQGLFPARPALPGV